METLHFTIFINAPREKVWKTMLEDKTYRQWTAAFHEGSYFEGGWNKGDKIKFLGPGEDGAIGGMTSEIAESIPGEFVSIRHLGVVENGVETFGTPWAGAMENYTFTDSDGGTQLDVDVDVDKSMAAMFQAMWPKALEKLKEIAEK